MTTSNSRNSSSSRRSRRVSALASARASRPTSLIMGCCAHRGLGDRDPPASLLSVQSPVSRLWPWRPTREDTAGAVKAASLATCQWSASRDPERCCKAARCRRAPLRLLAATLPLRGCPRPMPQKLASSSASEQALMLASAPAPVASASRWPGSAEVATKTARTNASNRQRHSRASRNGLLQSGSKSAYAECNSCSVGGSK